MSLRNARCNDKDVSNYLGGAAVVELMFCSGCFVDGLMETMRNVSVYIRLPSPDSKQSWDYKNPFGLTAQKAWMEIQFRKFGHWRLFEVKLSPIF
jgi:hypothetical protein